MLSNFPVDTALSRLRGFKGSSKLDYESSVILMTPEHAPSYWKSDANNAQIEYVIQLSCKD